MSTLASLGRAFGSCSAVPATSAARLRRVPSPVGLRRFAPRGRSGRGPQPPLKAPLPHRPKAAGAGGMARLRRAGRPPSPHFCFHPAAVVLRGERGHAGRNPALGPLRLPQFSGAVPSVGPKRPPALRSGPPASRPTAPSVALSRRGRRSQPPLRTRFARPCGVAGASPPSVLPPHRCSRLCSLKARPG